MFWDCDKPFAKGTREPGNVETVTEPTPEIPRSPRVAVAIPCYNEAAAIRAVIAEWREALPDAEIVVFNNNSNDGTADRARESSARVVEVPRQGKGYVVREIFRSLGEFDAVVMIDGDGTYSASNAAELLLPVLSRDVDLSVGIRRPVDSPGAMSPIRGFGNLVIGLAFRLLIGPGTTDLLSGYRVFGKACLQSFEIRSKGFEIETELASEAVSRRLKVHEAVVDYRPRIIGTASKLRAFHDGSRILKTIVKQSLRLRPWRLLIAVMLVAAAAFALIRALI